MALLENGLSQKCRTIYTVDEKGKKIKNGEIPIINDGTYEDYQGFLKILEMYLVSLGINQARQVLLIADGETSRRCRSPSRRTGEPEGSRVDRSPHSSTS